MTDQESSVPSSTRIVAELRELIAALDCRVPRIDRTGESHISMAAAMLRNEALTRIAELEHDASVRHPYDQELVEAMMTDDGGPSPEWGKHERDRIA